MKRNPNPKILANALFKISEQNNVLDDVNTSLIFLNAVAWALAIPLVPTIANLIIFYNYDLLDSLLLQLVEQDLFFPCYQYLLLFCLSTNQMFFQDKPNE